MKIARAAMRLRDTLVLCCKSPGNLQKDLLRTAIGRVVTDGGDRNLETIRETYERELRSAGKENDSIVSSRSEHFDDATPARVWNLLLRALALKTAMEGSTASPEFREGATKNLQRFIRELKGWGFGKETDTGRAERKSGSRVMHDVFPNSIFAPRSMADFKVQHMILFPSARAGFRSPVSLRWEQVPFSPTRAGEVPKDEGGVYSFVVQPGIADHPACSYLLYVGKTERNFRVRYKEYLADLRAGMESRRPHIAGMLTKWDGYLWFCYAPIHHGSKIEETEDALIEAYLPPTNVEMPGKLRHKMAFNLGT